MLATDARRHAETLRQYLDTKPLLSPRVREALAYAIDTLETGAPPPAERDGAGHRPASRKPGN